MPFGDEVRTRLDADADEIIARYPRSRSALLPLLHLVQSEEGHVSDDGIAYCAWPAGARRVRGGLRGQLLHHVQAPPGR